MSDMKDTRKGDCFTKRKGTASTRSRGSASTRGKINTTTREKGIHSTMPYEDVAVESESDVEILKVVWNPDVDPSVLAREQRVVKRKLTRMKQENLWNKQKP
ncbi:hypothetical protein LIER_17165 [Lithospermum erythrorhizon]|uniref:Uncharacterized protein n=1 Tax=Lithospermum erythrorhizon TaxID=34254 RepID=A0AAV3QBS6_LITER